MFENPKTETAQRHFYKAFLVLGILALTYVAIKVLGHFSVAIGIIAWAGVFVLCLFNFVDKLESKGISRGWGTLISYLLLIGGIVLVCFVVFSPVFNIAGQFGSIFQSLPDTAVLVSTWLSSVYDKIAMLIGDDTMRGWVEGFTASLSEAASTLAKVSATGVLEFGGNLIEFILILLFALVVAFWLLKDLPAISREIHFITPDEFVADLDFFFGTVVKVMGGYVKAVVIQAFLIGFVSAICFVIMGIPNPLALGVIVGVINIIPIVGPYIGAAIAACFGLFLSPLSALGAFLAALIAQKIIYYIIMPKVFQGAVDIHPALTIVAMFVGSAIGQYLGGLPGNIVGMLLGIPFAAIIKTVFVYYYERNTGRHLVSEDGVFFKGVPSEDFGDTHAKALADATAPSPKPRLKKPKVAEAVVGPKSGARPAENPEASSENAAEKPE